MHQVNYFLMAVEMCGYQHAVYFYFILQLLVFVCLVEVRDEREFYKI